MKRSKNAAKRLKNAVKRLKKMKKLTVFESFLRNLFPPSLLVSTVYSLKPRQLGELRSKRSLFVEAFTK